MVDHWLASLPPVQGCLFCHVEGAVSVESGHGRLPHSESFAVIKCSHCGSVAELDAAPEREDWRIRYRKVNSAERYYYVAHHFGGGEWFDRAEALQISTHGYVQRQRVRQAGEGDLSWLTPLPLDPLPAFVTQGESVFLEQRGVTLTSRAPQTWIFRSGRDEIVDSGKLYVTDRKLHLLGQRREWSIAWEDVQAISYDGGGWRIGVAGDEKPLELAAQQRASNEMDPQLFTAVVRNFVIR